MDDLKGTLITAFHVGFVEALLGFDGYRRDATSM